MANLQSKTRQTNRPKVKRFIVPSLEESNADILERKTFKEFLEENEPEEYPRKWVNLEIGKVYTVEGAKIFIGETLVLKLKKYGEVWAPARVGQQMIAADFLLYPPPLTFT